MIINPPLQEIISDAEVEKALYNRAVGIEFEETPRRTAQTKGSMSAAGSKSLTSNGASVKYIHPDVSACIFWLKNRLPDKWKDTKTDLEQKETFRDFVRKFGRELVEEVEEGKVKKKKSNKEI